MREPSKPTDGVSSNKSATDDPCPDGINPEVYASASPEHKSWLRSEIPMTDRLFDEIMGISR